MIFTADDIVGMPSLNFVSNRYDLEQYIDLLQSLSDFDLGLYSEIGEFVFARGDSVLTLDSNSVTSAVLDADFVGDLNLVNTQVQIFSSALDHDIFISDSKLNVLVDPDVAQDFSMIINDTSVTSELFISASKAINETLVSFDSNLGRLNVGNVTFDLGFSNLHLEIVDPNGFSVTMTELLSHQDDNLISEVPVETESLQTPKAAPATSSSTNPDVSGVDGPEEWGDSDLVISDSQMSAYLSDLDAANRSLSFEAYQADFSMGGVRRMPSRIFHDSNDELIFDEVMDEIGAQSTTLQRSTAEVEEQFIFVSDGNYVSQIVWVDATDMIDGLD
jgi:hypothetical protein